MKKPKQPYDVQDYGTAGDPNSRSSKDTPAANANTKDSINTPDSMSTDDTSCDDLEGLADDGGEDSNPETTKVIINNSNGKVNMLGVQKVQNDPKILKQMRFVTKAISTGASSFLFEQYRILAPISLVMGLAIWPVYLIFICKVSFFSFNIIYNFYFNYFI